MAAAISQRSRRISRFIRLHDLRSFKPSRPSAISVRKAFAAGSCTVREAVLFHVQSQSDLRRAKHCHSLQSYLPIGLLRSLPASNSREVGSIDQCTPQAYQCLIAAVIPAPKIISSASASADFFVSRPAFRSEPSLNTATIAAELIPAAYFSGPPASSDIPISVPAPIAKCSEIGTRSRQRHGLRITFFRGADVIFGGPRNGTRARS